MSLENNRQVSRRQRDKSVTDVTPMKAQERDQRRGEEIYPPLPPAGGIDFCDDEPDKPATKRSPERRLRFAQSEMERVETELQDIVRPGGCAYNVPPTGDKLDRYNKLIALRESLQAEVESARGALT